MDPTFFVKLSLFERRYREALILYPRNWQYRRTTTYNGFAQSDWSSQRDNEKNQDVITDVTKGPMWNVVS